MEQHTPICSRANREARAAVVVSRTARNPPGTRLANLREPTKNVLQMRHERVLTTYVVAATATG
jgi:hypothetical protein